MVSIEEICARFNQIHQSTKYRDVYIPVYKRKWKIYLISKIRLLFKTKGFYYFEEKPLKLSYINYWKFIMPDGWIKSSDAIKTSPESCKSQDLLWLISYYHEFWDYDLSYGIKPSNAAFDYSSSPTYYGSKLNGKIYGVPFSLFHLPYSLSFDHELFIKGEKSIIDWKKIEY